MQIILIKINERKLNDFNYFKLNINYYKYELNMNVYIFIKLIFKYLYT